jgi:hypothetical protein
MGPKVGYKGFLSLADAVGAFLTVSMSWEAVQQSLSKMATTEGDNSRSEESSESNIRIQNAEITIRQQPGEVQDVTEKKGEMFQPDEIEYLYLTFDTLLPTPVGILSPQPSQSPPPDCPDLKPYTSPFLWPKGRKTLITWISCAVTAIAAYSAGEFSPALRQLTPVWNVSPVVYELGITVFTTGFAVAPMVLAPLSEINGRRPIFISSGILFTGKQKCQ